MEAIVDYNASAIRLKPDLAEAYNNRGIVKADEAVKGAIVEAIRLKPDLAKAHNNLGKVSNLKQFKEPIVVRGASPEGLKGVAEAHCNRRPFEAYDLKQIRSSYR